MASPVPWENFSFGINVCKLSVFFSAGGNSGFLRRDATKRAVPNRSAAAAPVENKPYLNPIIGLLQKAVQQRRSVHLSSATRGSN